MIGDRDELIQLFQNLIHNAIKYGREGGHVWITLGTTAPDDDAQLSRGGHGRRRGHSAPRRCRA